MSKNNAAELLNASSKHIGLYNRKIEHDKKEQNTLFFQLFIEMLLDVNHKEDNLTH